MRCVMRGAQYFKEVYGPVYNGALEFDGLYSLMLEVRFYGGNGGFCQIHYPLNKDKAPDYDTFMVEALEYCKKIEQRVASEEMTEHWMGEDT